MLGLKLNHVSKRGHLYRIINILEKLYAHIHKKNCYIRGLLISWLFGTVEYD